MATLNTDLPTLSDLAKRWDPNGSQATLVEALTRKSSLLADMVWQEGNLPTGHRVSSRTGLPSITWRKFNEGVAPSKGKADQYDETVGMMEGQSAVDCELATLNGNAAAFRASEDKGFMAAFKNELETGMFYHSTKNAPEKFMGLSPRFDSLTGQAAPQIIVGDAGAAGNDQTSIWLVCWGPDTVFGIYPKGSQGGLQTHDMGVQMIDDGTGKKFRGYLTVWDWKAGLAVKDWRYVVRIANIDTSNLVATGSAIVDAMIKAYHQVEDMNMGRAVFYANRTVGTFLHLQAKNNIINSTLSLDNVAGKPIASVLGVPIRITDAILSTESAVS